jgi:hypothetical protein
VTVMTWTELGGFEKIGFWVCEWEVERVESG